MTSGSNERKLEIQYGGGEWVNVRSALVTPVPAKAGAYRKTKRDVRAQGYSLTQRRWSQTVVPLTASERAEGLRMMRRLGIKP